MNFASVLSKAKLAKGMLQAGRELPVWDTRRRSRLRIAVIGGGPGGLYFAYLWKKHHPEAQVDLFEQNAADVTWGFGVVFSEQALEFLRADDSDTVDAIASRMES